MRSAVEVAWDGERKKITDVPIGPLYTPGDRRAIPPLVTCKREAWGIPYFLLTCRDAGCFMHRLASIATSQCRSRFACIYANQMSTENGWQKVTAVKPTAGIISKLWHWAILEYDAICRRGHCQNWLSVSLIDWFSLLRWSLCYMSWVNFAFSLINSSKLFNIFSIISLIRPYYLFFALPLTASVSVTSLYDISSYS